jgi:hypothetical protein
MSDKEVVAIMTAIIYGANTASQSANITDAVNKAFEIFQAVEKMFPAKQKRK